MNKEAVLKVLKAGIPNLLAVYAFGSCISGTAGPQSDLDLAVLTPTYADPVNLWELSGDLADVVGRPVDLLDLRAASTVMQYQVITTGECWWIKDNRAKFYEVAILSEKTDFDTARAGLLQDIQKRGKVYG